jgi:acyl-coenzyme A thioesterase PaaI-like protein
LTDRRSTSRALTDELRAVLRALNERELTDEQLTQAVAIARQLRAGLDGPRRPRWYERGIVEGRSTDGTRSSFNTHSLFRGRDSAIAIPLDCRVVTLADGRQVVEGTVTCSLLYEGPPGGVHGGYVAGLFDDILGGTQQLIEGQSGLTGTLTVRYRSITPLETELHLRAWIDHVSGRRIRAKATCHAEGRLTAEAEALFIRVDMGQIAERATAS